MPQWRSGLRRNGVDQACVSHHPRSGRQRLVARLAGIEIAFSPFFQFQQRVVGALGGPDEFVELDLNRLGAAVLGSRFRKTIGTVMMVVPVLMTSCQVSLSPKSGPVTNYILKPPRL